MRFSEARDERAVSPVMATILLVAVVIVLAASVFLLTGGFGGQVKGPAPLLVLVDEPTGHGLREWQLRLHSAAPPKPVEEYLFILRTATNGTLVATPDAGAMVGTLDLYFQLGASAGTGLHTDNGTIGAEGLGGFHYRITDTDVDGRLGAGDRFEWWYDGDGDQAHATNADDSLPRGAYVFEIKHVLSDAYVAMDERDF